jgi:hypothetical protein
MRVRRRVSIPAIATTLCCLIGAEILGRAKVAVCARDFPHHHAGDVDAIRLGVFSIGTDVPDMGIGQRHDLLAIRGIGHDFLVAGHGSVEYHLPDGLTVTPDGNPFEN